METMNRLYPYVVDISYFILYVGVAYGIILFVQYSIKELKEQWEELQVFLKTCRTFSKKVRLAKKRARRKALMKKLKALEEEM